MIIIHLQNISDQQTRVLLQEIFQKEDFKCLRDFRVIAHGIEWMNTHLWVPLGAYFFFVQKSVSQVTMFKVPFIIILIHSFWKHRLISCWFKLHNPLYKFFFTWCLVLPQQEKYDFCGCECLEPDKGAAASLPSYSRSLHPERADPRAACSFNYFKCLEANII